MPVLKLLLESQLRDSAVVSYRSYPVENFVFSNVASEVKSVSGCDCKLLLASYVNMLTSTPPGH